MKRWAGGGTYTPQTSGTPPCSTPFQIMADRSIERYMP